MALPAGLNDVLAIYARLRIIRWLNRVHSVAIRADCELGLHCAGLEQLAVVCFLVALYHVRINLKLQHLLLSPWQDEQSLMIPSAVNCSLVFLISFSPWQSVQVGASVIPCALARPWIDFL